jgi:hypothetical protein
MGGGPEECLWNERVEEGEVEARGLMVGGRVIEVCLNEM